MNRWLCYAIGLVVGSIGMLVYILVTDELEARDARQ